MICRSAFLVGRRRRTEIGRLVSASHSPRLQVNMGYAWLPVQMAVEGTRIEIGSPEGPTTATVTALLVPRPEEGDPARS